MVVLEVEQEEDLVKAVELVEALVVVLEVERVEELVKAAE